MSAIKVYLRIRPPPSGDQDEQNKTPNCPSADQAPPAKPSCEFRVSQTKFSKQLTVRVDRKHFNDRSFEFEDIFGPQVSQTELFGQFQERVLESALNGVNFCLMAYGQTSAGKTHTLFGDLNSPAEGVVPRFSRALFEKLSELEAAGADQVKVSVSLFEIYKEKVYDLFAAESPPPLQLREDPVKGVYFEGLSAQRFSGVTAFLDSLYTAFVKRKVSETLMNERSSRSHLVVTFDVEVTSQIECPESNSGMIEITKRSKVIFIDLAGSERQSSNTAEVLSEGCHINKSLSVLQHVIAAIARRKASEFIHYRDSKLTHFLKEIFKGNSHFAVLGCVLAQPEHHRETLNTLNFVALAKRIATNPQINFETREGAKLMERRLVELLSQNLKSGVSAQTARVEESLTALRRETDRVLAELERLQLFCDNSLKFDGFEAFKVAAEELDFAGLSELQKSYSELSQLLEDQSSEKQPLDLQRLTRLLEEIRGEVDCRFEEKRERVLQRIDDLLGAVQLRIGQPPQRPLSAKPRASVHNKSADLSDRGCEIAFPDNLMKTLRSHSNVLRQPDLQAVNASDIKPVDCLNGSAIRGSALFNGTGTSFLGSFLQPLGQGARSLTGDFEKEISQSINAYFQRERELIESEKTKLEREKSVFEEFREREMSAAKCDFRKSAAKSKDAFELIANGEALENDNDTSNSTLKVAPSSAHSRGRSKVAVEQLNNQLQLTPERKSRERPSVEKGLKEATPGKRQTEGFLKRINNLERQLRNRNKDYLFALKELEKVKSVSFRQTGETTSQQEVSNI